MRKLEVYIIEHPTRGTLRDMEFDTWPYVRATPTFSRTGSRSDPEATVQFLTLADAKTARNKIKDNKVVDACKIYRQTLTGWELVDETED